MTALEFAGPAIPLSSGDIDAEAEDIGCHPAVIRAICDVEAAGSGFLADRRPKLLFEAHVFWRLTGGRFGRSNVSSPVWDRSLYGAGGAHQYDRLEEASRLDRRAALKSASWGLFQIMGFNHPACGHGDIESFVAAIRTGERAHLDAFTTFCVFNGLDGELRAMPPRFAAFARRYNGPGHAVNAYQTKLAAAWRKWRAVAGADANPAPRTAPEHYHTTQQMNSFGGAVRALQRRLVALGYDIAADGDFGPETQWAVIDLQRAHGLIPDGIVGPSTRAALDRAQGL